jgi:hypothetical protein
MNSRNRRRNVVELVLIGIIIIIDNSLKYDINLSMINSQLVSSQDNNTNENGTFIFNILIFSDYGFIVKL